MKISGVWFYCVSVVNFELLQVFVMIIEDVYCQWLEKEKKAIKIGCSIMIMPGTIQWRLNGRKENEDLAKSSKLVIC